MGVWASRQGQTSTLRPSLGTLFGRLVAESAETLLDGQNPGDFIFVEFGAEPGTSVLDGVEHPFQDIRTLRLGDPLQVDAPAVVFANEWLDAQPFHRLVLENGIWREIGVSIAGGKLEEIRLEEISEGALPYVGNLPTDLPDGYHFDLPTGASEALRALAGQSWQGLFLTLDYGKSLAEMLETTPQGTARAYSNHKQSNDLLANPGEQDLTCHVCWDWLEKILTDNGFEQVGSLRQEALFMRHAQTAIRRVLEDSNNLNGKGRLAELLHPAHLGLKFQALHGLRR